MWDESTKQEQLFSSSLHRSIVNTRATYSNRPSLSLKISLFGTDRDEAIHQSQHREQTFFSANYKYRLDRQSVNKEMRLRSQDAKSKDIQMRFDPTDLENSLFQTQELNHQDLTTRFVRYYQTFKASAKNILQLDGSTELLMSVYPKPLPFNYTPKTNLKAKDSEAIACQLLILYLNILMSLSKLKERLKHYKSLGNIHQGHEVYQTECRLNDYSYGNALKISKNRRDIESRLATEINEKIVTSKEELKKYAKILQLNPKPKKTDNKSKNHNSSKANHHAASSTKRTFKEKMLSPVVSKFKTAKEVTEAGSQIHNNKVKGKKGLKKIRQQKSQAKWKYEYTQNVPATQKTKKSRSREAISRQKSRKKLHKVYTEVSLDSTPSSMFTEEVELLQQIGEGTFGKVFKGRMRRNREIVAVKRVLQDSRYKNREIEIVKILRDDFVCEILGTYITHEGRHQYLNILMRYYEENLYQRIKSYPVGKMPSLETKIIIYQLFKGLSYLHSLNICHRDIKPENVLLRGNRAAICDFGSAKMLMPQENNISYICARCYRAPELIFGATRYTTQVDIWSAGCVVLEILNGDPLFIGQTSITHLLQIIKILGTPQPQEVLAMNSQYDISSYNFPRIKKKQWSQVLPEADIQLLKLLSRVIIYAPEQRATALEVLALDYFDQLRDQLTYSHISSMYHLPNFFAFSKQQIYGREHLLEKLIPKWSKHA